MPPKASTADQPTTTPKQDPASLKRVREGSLEPAQAESSAALATKKNRVAPTSSARRAADASEELIEQEGEEDVDADADGAADTAEENVGEVRKRVEKMSYEEAQSKTNDNNNNNDNDNAADESWEKIEKEEMENTKGDGLKRKALDRNDTSFTTVEEDVAAAKRQKDTPSPTGEEPAQPPKKPQASFSAFASSASPFASLKTASPSPALQGAAPAPAHNDATPAIAPPVPRAREEEKKKQPTFGDFAKSSPFTSGKSTPALITPAEDEAGSSTSSSTPAVPARAPAVASAPAPAPAPPTKKPQTTFSSFSSSSSPFPSSKPSPSPFASGSAPIKGSAFGTYSNNSAAFGTAARKSAMAGAAAGAGGEAGTAGMGAGAGEEKVGQGKKGASFGDILKESKGDVEIEKEGKVAMQEQDVTTGEEDEDTVFQARSKLFVNEKGWKERGVGLLKLNVRRSDGSGARLVMRADGVLRLLLNSKLYKGLNPTVEGKTVLMTLPNVGEKEMAIICLRMSNIKVAEELADFIHEHIPLDSANTSKSPQPQV
ncbi:ran-binding protein 3 [Cryptococcus neoformans Gb118]|nr:ran-binding protein 3 [Cryptococcus neoformans var. grubii MW-RSA36]OXL06079.1 ran-binding protein 3 [Cryptococcus neoformans var. grubii Gb118]